MTKEIPLTRGYVALVDDADYEFLMQWKWSACGYGPVYAVRGYRVAKKTCPIKMHRQIIGVSGDWIVDHVNRNSLDNRKINLRLVTPDQSAQNRSAKNRSGYRGVYQEKSKFRAIIQARGWKRNLGLFATVEEAARAYDAAAIEMHGVYAVVNFT